MRRPGRRLTSGPTSTRLIRPSRPAFGVRRSGRSWSTARTTAVRDNCAYALSPANADPNALGTLLGDFFSLSPTEKPSVSTAPDYMRTPPFQGDAAADPVLASGALLLHHTDLPGTPAADSQRVAGTPC